MPHRANRLIVQGMVDQGWFQNARTKGLPSDNWWLMEDAKGRTVLLCIVPYSAESESGEPEELPNEPALPRIVELQQVRCEAGSRGRTRNPCLRLLVRTML